MQYKAAKAPARSWLIPAMACILMSSLGLVSVVFAQEQGGSQRIEPARQTIQPNHDVAPSEDSTHQPTPTVGSDYVIGSEDVLRVSVFNVPELADLELRVANDGTIAPPLLGHIQAAGLTPSQLRLGLEKAWGEKYLENPQVSIFVKEFHAQPVSVVGAVDKPGLYPMTGPRTLIEMLSTAGGLARRADAIAGRSVYVTRSGGFAGLHPVEGMRLLTPDKVEINIHKLLYSKEDALNIPIHPRDIISVSKADVVYVAGRGIQKPGGFILEDRDTVTVFQALAMAEGLGPNAAKHDARIIRRQPDGSRLEIPVDLDKVLKGKEPDPEMAANDILFVPDSAQKAALKRALDSTIATVSGLLIFGRL